MKCFRHMALSPLEVAVAILAAIPALIAGYLYGRWILGLAS